MMKSRLDHYVNLYCEAEEQLQKGAAFPEYWKAKTREAGEKIDFLADDLLQSKDKNNE